MERKIIQIAFDSYTKYYGGEPQGAASDMYGLANDGTIWRLNDEGKWERVNDDADLPQD